MKRTRDCLRAVVVTLLATLAPGCAQFTPDSGMSAVTSIATASLGKDVVRRADPDSDAEARARVRTLLAKPVTAGNAVQIALLNNQGLQAQFAELAAAEAQSIEAGLPPSPTLSISRLVATGHLEIERQILQNILGLATLPRRREIAEARFRQAQLRAGEAVLKLAADTRRAWISAVAAEETIGIVDEALRAAASTSELAKRLGESGGLNKLDQAREHAFTAEIGADLATARLAARIARERLTRLMGLWGGETAYRLPASLPKLPGAPRTLPGVEQDAVARRIDLAIARAEIDILARQLGLTEPARLVNVLELRGIDTRERVKQPLVTPSGPAVEIEKTHWRGLELEIQIPLFDFGRARLANAQALYMQAAHRLADRAITARSEVREAYQAYRGTYDIARHYRREILPLRQTISEETLLRYNAMLTDLFQLLLDARARVMSRRAALAAVRDHWLAATDLDTAILGGGKGSSVIATGPAMSATAEPGGGH